MSDWHLHSVRDVAAQLASNPQVGLNEAEAQERLHRRFSRLSLRGVHHNKVVVAIARELTAFIWELARVVARMRAQRPLAPA